MFYTVECPTESTKEEIPILNQIIRIAKVVHLVAIGRSVSGPWFRAEIADPPPPGAMEKRLIAVKDVGLAAFFRSRETALRSRRRRGRIVRN